MDKHCVVLNDIHIDIMDYIAPASCSDLTFRAMWAEFEWENKVAVNTDVADVKEFLARGEVNEHEVPDAVLRLDGDSGFLAANLYAKSIFGEDALVNVSVEKRSDGKISATSAFAARPGYRALPRRQDHDQAETAPR